jgi:hypothetical protein
VTLQVRDSPQKQVKFTTTRNDCESALLVVLIQLIITHVNLRIWFTPFKQLVACRFHYLIISIHTGKSLKLENVDFPV